MNKNWIILILSLIILFFIGYIIYQNKLESPQDPIYVTQRDTLCIHDTIIEKKTKVEYKTQDKILYIYTKDTVRDTVEIPIDIEHKIYKDTIKNDSSSYDISIRYSGFNSKIDEVIIKTEYINKYNVPVYKPRKFHISVLVGVGVQYGLVRRQFDVGPYVGIGGSYDLW